MAHAEHGIEVEGLVRRFKQVEAVAGIDLAISPGEIYGFLGPNGAGKSTTVHMLTTLLQTGLVSGFDISTEADRVRVQANRGNREALRALEILDPLWAKIRAANQ